MAPHMAKLDASIEPGLTMLNWTSLNLNAYLESVYEALRELDLLLTRAQDLVTFRIDGVLNEMSVVPLCELPSDTSWTVEEFLKNTEVNYSIVTPSVPTLPTHQPTLSVEDMLYAICTSLTPIKMTLMLLPQRTTLFPVLLIFADVTLTCHVWLYGI